MPAPTTGQVKVTSNVPGEVFIDATASLVARDEHAAKIFLPGGSAPKVGQMHAQPLIGARLREIAAKGAAGFYEGETAAKMAAHLKSLGGLQTEEDFHDARDAAHWVEPEDLDLRQ